VPASQQARLKEAQAEFHQKPSCWSGLELVIHPMDLKTVGEQAVVHRLPDVHKQKLPLN